MILNEIRIRLLHSSGPGTLGPFACEDIAIGKPGGVRTGQVDLLVVDARDMETEAIHGALRQVAEWNAAGVFRVGLVVWPQPTVEGLVLAIRAGLHDAVPTGVGLRQLVRLLCGSLPNRAQRRGQMRRILHVLRLGRPAAPWGARPSDLDFAERFEDEQRALFERQLALREATLTQREQELKKVAARVQADLDRANQACAVIELAADMRSELEERENELRLMARQPAQAESVPAPAPGRGASLILRRELESLLQTQQSSLDQRERALKTREGLLRDYEHALTGRLVGSEAN